MGGTYSKFCTLIILVLGLPPYQEYGPSESRIIWQAPHLGRKHWLGECLNFYFGTCRVFSSEQTQLPWLFNGRKLSSAGCAKSQVYHPEKRGAWFTITPNPEKCHFMESNRASWWWNSLHWSSAIIYTSSFHITPLPLAEKLPELSTLSVSSVLHHPI